MDYFNKDERAEQRAFTAARDRIFSPLVRALAALKVTPNQVSLAGTLFLLLVCFIPPSLALWATGCMAMYVLCDGIDGPLARRLGHTHAGGSLIDIVADQLGVVLLSAAAIQHFDSWGPAMVLFACFYLAFIALVVYANGLGVELRRFIRSKYLFFLLYLGSLFLQKDLLTYFCGIFAAYYCVESMEALHRIYTFHERHAGQLSGTHKE
ncbi:CDP-alcohol phosphatidyltransferase family protein [Pseudodesulfovibrio sp.]|uniref:CDP-alcohol phosphatidyltransferase family protein n=1 Tax=unclassified Pseudodesulfovibrio TaxID=2661612 RepID=UPI003B001E74